MKAAFAALLCISFLWLGWQSSPVDPEASVQGDQRRRPVDVFKELDGKWQGTFVCYGTGGEEMNRISVAWGESASRVILNVAGKKQNVSIMQKLDLR